MGMATERLGLGATYSTTYYEPFHVARMFATLDLMTDGRAAWNVVTSLNDGEALNMGRDEDHRARPALRPRRRVHGGRARPLGRLGGRRADRRQGDAAASPIRTRCIGSTTRASSSARAGRSPCRARPQGHPVVIQAGRAAAAKRFAARWAEVIFVAYPRRRVRQARVRRVQGGRSRSRGRDPDAGEGRARWSTRRAPRPRPRPRTRWR